MQIVFGVAIQSVTHRIRLAPIIVIAAVGPAFAATADGDVTKGEVLYRTCQACHGDSGEGNQAAGAPRLAGQHQWYLASQLRKFRSGVRGSDARDTLGLIMGEIAKTLPSEAAIEDVIAYIATLDAPPSPRTEKTGDPTRGKAFYTSCTQCHGSKGQGLRKVSYDWETPHDSPRLAGQHDWYLIRQLEKFKANIRGSHEQDKEGLAMRAQVKTLYKDQMIKDVVAYIQTL